MSKQAVRKLEIIAASIEDAIQAQAGGASSLELVQNLAVGGLTPSLELVKAIRDAVNISLRVILRPHADSFMYSPADMELILKDIDALKKIGADGIVFGALHEDKAVDVNMTSQIARAAYPLEMTFHRAIDVSRDADIALPMLKGMIQRILTSGQADNVWDGRVKIGEWVAEYGQDFTFASGGGIRLEQLEAIVQATDAPEYHLGTAVQTNGIVDSTKVRSALQIIYAA
jgi:copper homeostasis protein